MATVLSVVWYKVFPAVFGGQKGIAEFNHHLAGHHSLFCVCSTDNDTTGLTYPAMPVLRGGRLGFLIPSNWATIIRAVRRTGATHLLIEHAYYGWAGLLARRMTGAKVVVHAHNIESKVFRDNGRWYWRAVRALEKSVYRRCDLVLFKTEADRRFAVDRWGMEEAGTHVVPFGISRRSNPDEDERREASERIRRRYSIPEGCRILLFCGTLDYEPNARALNWMVEELLPEMRRQGYRDFRLIATGRLEKPDFGWVAALRDPYYLYPGVVDDISDLMKGSDLFVNPVDSGGGIKVKNMEALSYGLTVVTTIHSATGIYGKPTGGKMVVVDRGDLSGFARAVAENWANHEPTPEAFFEVSHWDRIAADASERIETC